LTTPTRSLLAALALLSLCATPAAAGIVRGRLWLSASAAAAAGSARSSADPSLQPGRKPSAKAGASTSAPTSWPAGAVTNTASKPSTTGGVIAVKPSGPTQAKAQEGVTDAVLYVEQVPDAVERKLAKPRWLSRPPRPRRIVQSKLRFQPRVMAALAGSTVELQNLDRVYHNAFSVSAAMRFDLGKYPPGKLDTLVFQRPGVVNLHCDIHPEEIGYVVVVPNHAYARPDSIGRFQLPKLPAGSYTLHVWHPRLGELRRPFQVPARGNVALEIRY
jgi:hypothetical protein